VTRTLPGPARDVALLLARLILGTIMLAHGYQKLFINASAARPRASRT
jgi:putative oxidoreductase